MTDIDLTEAVEAGARAEGNACLQEAGFEGYAPRSQNGFRNTARRIIAAALPHIEHQVREQVARKIEAELPRVVELRDASEYEEDKAYYNGADVYLAAAARIARGEQLPECPFTFAHTRHWCGNPTCRES